MENVKEKHIVSFSGGKDSTAMLLMMIEKGMQIDDIIFCDTGMEFPEMYEHIEKFKEYIKRPITMLKSDKSFEYYMFDHEKQRGSRKGEHGYGWYTGKNKWCTQLLKKSVVDKYLKHYKDEGYKIIEYHGIAYDEPDRIGRNKEKNVKYPLYEWEIIESEALQYCYDKGFDWGGLYKKFKRVSCWCCPQSNLAELSSLYTCFPDLWSKLKKMDNRASNQFRLDYTLDELELRFSVLNDFKKVLDRHDLNCTNKLKKAIVSDLRKEMFKVVTD